MDKIYLDHSATTPVAKEVLEAMLPYFSDKFGNPSSIHFFGQEARSEIDNARKEIANFLNCQTTEIVFTSGGSESDNLAIRGVVEAISDNFANELPHIVTTAFEHHAVLNTVKELERQGKIEVTYIRPDEDGIIQVSDVESAIKENTILVSVMYVNNEIGTVQPIREIGAAIKTINKKLKIKNNKYGRIYFHTDAVQAAEYFNMNVDYLHVDLLTMTAHKIYGPKGIGLLYVRSGTPIKSQITGGGQEYKKRAGTENVAGIVGFAVAIKLINKSKIKRQNCNSKVINLRDKLIDGLLRIPDSRLNGSRKFRTPANVNVSFLNAEGESILLNLDIEGIAASSGSACTSGSLDPSHVLLAIGIRPEDAHGSIRFTLGRETTEQEIDKVLEVMPKIVEKLRKMSPFNS